MQEYRQRRNRLRGTDGVEPLWQTWRLANQAWWTPTAHHRPPIRIRLLAQKSPTAFVLISFSPLLLVLQLMAND